ncbi:MAG: hypothetical protein CO021_00360 [Deltaproteobacteria bacterium CG_4_9_14_0_2_um_filter_42_21]|nr:MAG: hypothetical protein CO021_00360 [Deltaproteobacteria bacterium CG_4_9_14_0_2_um_filter_42_21]
MLVSAFFVCGGLGEKSSEAESLKKEMKVTFRLKVNSQDPLMTISPIFCFQDYSGVQILEHIIRFSEFMNRFFKKMNQKNVQM